MWSKLSSPLSMGSLLSTLLLPEQHILEHWRIYQYEPNLVLQRDFQLLQVDLIPQSMDFQHHLGPGPIYKHMVEILTSRVNPYPEPMTREESFVYQINQEELESIYTEKVMSIPLNLTIGD